MGTWNLDILYTGFDTEEFKGDMKTMEELIPSCARLAEMADKMDGKSLLIEYINLSESLSSLTNKLAIYANLRYSANTRDTEAASMLGRIMSSVSATAAPMAALEIAISKI